MTAIILRHRARQGRRRTGHKRMRAGLWILASVFSAAVALALFISLGGGTMLAFGPRIQRAGQVQDRAVGAPRSPNGLSVPAVTLDMLARLPVAAELPVRPGAGQDGGYAGFPTFPVDPAHGCFSVRDYVLDRQSLAETVQRDCAVASGRWTDPFTGTVHLSASEMGVTPLVPFAEAVRSGAGKWPASWVDAYASDTDAPWTLIAASHASLESRGGRDPARWLPPDASFHCDYARMWVAIKLRWQMTADRTEIEALADILKRCPE